MKSADDLFKSITGFDEMDVNFLEGVHTTFNSLLSRFEIALDDNRNTSYPFEYCWNKTNEGKAKSDKSGDDEEESEEDEFEEMWSHSTKDKVIDNTTNFGNEVKIDKTQSNAANIDNTVKIEETQGTSLMIDKVHVIDKQVDEDIEKSSIEKKS